MPHRQEQLKVLKKIILENNQELEIYLFGSYATGKVHPDSDIDILLLTDKDMSYRELREERYRIEDDIMERFGLEQEVQLLMYNKCEFEEYKEKPGLAREISSYMLKM